MVPLATPQRRRGHKRGYQVLFTVISQCIECARGALGVTMSPGSGIVRNIIMPIGFDTPGRCCQSITDSIIPISCRICRNPVHVISRAPRVRSLPTGRRLPPIEHRFPLIGHGLCLRVHRFSLMGHGFTIMGHRFPFMARGLPLRRHRFPLLGDRLSLRVNRFPLMGYGLYFGRNRYPIRDNISIPREGRIYVKIIKIPAMFRMHEIHNILKIIKMIKTPKCSKCTK